jgi:hypothetical protein
MNSTGDNQRVTRQEMTANLTADFDNVDTNGDGMLSYSEFKVLKEKHFANQMANKFVFLDQDESGDISANEFADGHPYAGANEAATVFTFADQDNNGVLSQPELEKLMASGDQIWHFVHLDSDGNGNVSKNEFLAAPPPPPGRHHHP